MTLFCWKTTFAAKSFAIAINGLEDGEITHIRCYHLCRPESTDSYYQNGILPMEPSQVHEQFRRICADCDCAQVEKIIAEDSLSAKPQRRDVYVGLCQNWLANQCRDYAAYHGGEFLKSLCVRLKPPQSHRLAKIGKPTIFEVNIPVQDVGGEDLDSLVDALRELKSNEEPETFASPDMLDWTVNFPKGIPFEWIVGHTHPSNIS